jgi:hypothetical protein
MQRNHKQLARTPVCVYRPRHFDDSDSCILDGLDALAARHATQTPVIDGVDIIHHFKLDASSTPRSPAASIRVMRWANPGSPTSPDAQSHEQSDEDEGEEEENGGEAETKRGLEKIDLSKLSGIEILSMFDLELPSPPCSPPLSPGAGSPGKKRWASRVGSLSPESNRPCLRHATSDTAGASALQESKEAASTRKKGLAYAAQNTAASPLSPLPTDESVIRFSVSPSTAPRDVPAMRRPNGWAIRRTASDPDFQSASGIRRTASDPDSQSVFVRGVRRSNSLDGREGRFHPLSRTNSSDGTVVGSTFGATTSKSIVEDAKIRRSRSVDFDSLHVGEGGAVGESPTCTSSANAAEGDLISALHTVHRSLVVKGRPSASAKPFSERESITDGLTTCHSSMAGSGQASNTHHSPQLDDTPSGNDITSEGDLISFLHAGRLQGRPASARHPLQRTASADGYRPASDRHPPQRTASADGHRPTPGPRERWWMPFFQKSNCHMNRNISSKCNSLTDNFTHLQIACL